MKVLITRPAEEGAEIAQKLAAMGHEAHLAPLLEVDFFHGAPLDLAGVQAVLATSANGVRAFAMRSDARDLPLFAVGPQTAAAAQKAGFIRVRNAAGDAMVLAARAGEWADPARGSLLHAAGEDAPGILAETLRAQGFQVRRENLYRIKAAQELPAATIQALAQGTIGAALFFSPRSAEAFAACVHRAGLTALPLIAVCISGKTAKALDRLIFFDMRIATSPDQDSILSRL